MKKVASKALKILPYVLMVVLVVMIYARINGQNWFDSSSHHEDLWEVRMDFWRLQYQDPNHSVSGKDLEKINARKDQVVSKARQDLEEQGRWKIVISGRWNTKYSNTSPDPIVVIFR